MAGKGLRPQENQGMLNKVMIIGRLGRDPELRYIQGSGTPVATLNVATDDSFEASSTWREASVPASTRTTRARTAM